MKKVKNIWAKLIPLPGKWGRIIKKRLLNNPWNLDFKPEKSNMVKENTKMQKMDVLLHLKGKKCHVPESL